MVSMETVAMEERELLETVQQAESERRPMPLANALVALAEHYQKAGHHTQAAPLYERVRSLWQPLLGSDHPVLGTLLVNLAQCYVAMGAWPAADPLFRQALVVFEGDVDFGDEGAVQALQGFAEGLRNQGATQDALLIEERVRSLAALVHVTVRA